MADPKKPIVSLTEEQKLQILRDMEKLKAQLEARAQTRKAGEQNA